MAKKSMLGKLIEPESIIAAAAEVEKEITGVHQTENAELMKENQSANDDDAVVETPNTDTEEKQVFDLDYFFKEITGKKIEYRPSLVSAEFLDRIKYLSIVFDVPMKDITYNICTFWWETYKEQILKAAKKKKKDFM